MRTLLVLLVSASVARAQSFYDRYPWFPRLVGAQFTYIWQDLPPFNAPYSGHLSLENHGDNEGTHTYGVYLGSRLTSWVQLYTDFEMARGSGVSHAYGLAGLTDGDVIRQGSVDLGAGPYLARAYARFMIPLGRERDTADRGQDQVPGPEPSRRIEIKAGKFALNDDFDLNRYANTTRYQFMDWSLWNNTAWDFAADTRGYTNGFMVGYVSPRWALKVAASQVSTFSNGNTFDGDIPHAYALNAELTWHPDTTGTVLRFLVFENHARMGSYRDAINIAQARDTAPCIVCDDRRGRIKYGFGFNMEQPLADSGNTGVFLRAGWSDGKNEDFEFTEVDRVVSGGLVLAGNMWHRPTDRFGIAGVIEGLSKDHENYLAAGGCGFLICDGKLRYGTENIVEAYYRFQPPFLDFVQITPAIQHVDHPAYNEDRGPLYVYTVRVNLHY
ncbi:MAG TPA: carbohydrate porin [Gemmatimonadaceae bacterium]|nr:carbohydrate porin [Gemmatimonadaceae bacterium]